MNLKKCFIFSSLIFIATPILQASSIHPQQKMFLQQTFQDISSTINQATKNGQTKQHIISLLEAKYDIPFSHLFESFEQLEPSSSDSNAIIKYVLAGAATLLIVALAAKVGIKTIKNI